MLPKRKEAAARNFSIVLWQSVAVNYLPIKRKKALRIEFDSSCCSVVPSVQTAVANATNFNGGHIT